MARGKAQSMPAPRKKGHQNESGKPNNDRGKPPHKGGHRSGSMRKPTFKVGGKADGSGGVSMASPWNAGKSKPSAAFDRSR